MEAISHGLAALLPTLGPFLGPCVLLLVIQLAVLAKVEDKWWRVRLLVATALLQMAALGAMVAIAVAERIGR